MSLSYEFSLWHVCVLSPQIFVLLFHYQSLDDFGQNHITLI